MSVTVTLDLPDELASRLARLPEEERRQFSVAAIADALSFRDDEQDCVDVVEQALLDTDEGRGLISFEEVCRQWDTERAGFENKHRP